MEKESDGITKFAKEMHEKGYRLFIEYSNHKQATGGKYGWKWTVKLWKGKHELSYKRSATTLMKAIERVIAQMKGRGK